MRYLRKPYELLSRDHPKKEPFPFSVCTSVRMPSSRRIVGGFFSKQAVSIAYAISIILCVIGTAFMPSLIMIS